MSSWQRTHTCGELSPAHEGQEVVLNGWVENYRDHGGILFLDLRDRHGTTQVVVDQERREVSEAMFEAACRLRAETVVSVRGSVAKRDADTINPKRITGAIELFASTIEVLAEADTPPFEVLDKVEANEELRMRYRYLDLRRRRMAMALDQRSRFLASVRSCLVEHGFLEVETPILTKSTPEGARDYLVPSRVTPVTSTPCRRARSSSSSC